MEILSASFPPSLLIFFYCCFQLPPLCSSFLFLSILVSLCHSLIPPPYIFIFTMCLTKYPYFLCFSPYICVCFIYFCPFVCHLFLFILFSFIYIFIYMCACVCVCVCIYVYTVYIFPFPEIYVFVLNFSTDINNKTKTTNMLIWLLTTTLVCMHRKKANRKMCCVSLVHL